MKFNIKTIFSLLIPFLISLPMLSCGSGGDSPAPSPSPGSGAGGSASETFKPDAGNDLYGQITDNHGQALAGVVVSDGYQNVVTNAKGWYQMKRNAKALYVNYSIPKGFKANASTFYKTLGATTKQYDFKLVKLATDEPHFNLLVMADPQAKINSDVQRFRTETMPDIKKTVEASTLPVYGLCLGDVVD